MVLFTRGLTWTNTFFGRFAAARNTPICIVTPTTPHELAVIVKALASVDVQFAVRSGGRSPAPKAANIRDGVLIDMSLFNEVSYDATTNLAVIGPGLTWGAVYKTLEAFNVTVVGGRVTDVGVGGLILGGTSYFYHTWSGLH